MTSLRSLVLSGPTKRVYRGRYVDSASGFHSWSDDVLLQKLVPGMTSVAKTVQKV